MARWECDFCGSEGTLPDGVIVEQEQCPNCGEPVMEVR
jgi:ribosomal protein S27AE